MTFSVVQSVVATGTGNPTLTLNGVAQNNALVLFALIAVSNTISGAADSQASYTPLVTLAGTPTNLGCYAFGLAGANSGTHAVTVSTSAGGAWGAVALCEISGASTTSPFDVGAGLFVGNGSYTATQDGLSFGPATTTHNGALILTFMSPGGTNDQATSGTGFVVVVNSTSSAVSNHTYIQTKTQSTAGTITPTMSPTGTGDDWGTVWVALAPAPAPLVVGKPLVTGPGISPERRSMFRSRQLSANIPPNTLGGGFASWQGAGYGQLTGVFTPPPIGLKREFGPGPSPDYERTFYRPPMATNAAVIGTLTGVASWQAGGFGSIIANASMQGLASWQGVGSAAVLTGAAAISGLASWQGSGVGALSSASVPNITGVAAWNGYAYGTLTAVGALSGQASAQSGGYGSLSGAGQLTGTASWQGGGVASLAGSIGMLAGVSSWQGTAAGALTGSGALQGRATAMAGASGLLTGVGQLVGAAQWAGGAYGSVTGIGALAGVAAAQAGAFGAMQGAIQIAGVASWQSFATGLLIPFGAGQLHGLAAGFSYAYGALQPLAHVYGYAQITALSQNGLPVARACYIEGSSCVVTAAYFDRLGEPFVPNAVQYRVDDVTSGFNILPWTQVGPGLVNVITITSAQNAMISLTRASEAHQVLFQITDGTGNVYYADVQFDLIRVAGLA